MRPTLKILTLALSLLGCQAALVEDLDEAAANDALTALSGQGIDAQKRGRGRRFTITVPRGDLPRAWVALQREGLPRPRAPQPEGGMLGDPGSAAEAARLQKAQAISALLRRWPGVVDAAVVLGRRGAAVTLRLKPDAAPLPAGKIKSQVMVAGDLPSTEAVVIVQHAAEARPLPPSAPPWRRSGAPWAALPFALAVILLWLRLKQVQRAQNQ